MHHSIPLQLFHLASCIKLSTSWITSPTTCVNTNCIHRNKYIISKNEPKSSLSLVLLHASEEDGDGTWTTFLTLDDLDDDDDDSFLTLDDMKQETKNYQVEKEESESEEAKQISTLQNQITTALRTNSYNTLPPLFDSYYTYVLTILESSDSQYDIVASALEWSLTYMDANNDGVKERLVYTYRLLGRYEDAALQLISILSKYDSAFFEKEKEEESLMEKETLSWLYLDLGSLLEQMKPLPGTSYPWDDITQSCPSIPLSSPLLCKKEEYTALECYQRAIEMHPPNGEAHKRLADLYMALHLYEEGLQEFEVANQCMGNDICCLTHLFYGTKEEDEEKKHKVALPMSTTTSTKTTLEDVTFLLDTNNDKDWSKEAATLFETHGVISFPSLLSNNDCTTLSSIISDVSSSVTSSEEDDDLDFTSETRNAHHRLHMALPLSSSPATLDIFSKVGTKLYPLLSYILQIKEEEGERIPLLGVGFMKVYPGATQQILHKDVHGYDRYDAQQVDKMPPKAAVNLNGGIGQERAISIQIQLTDTSTTNGDSSNKGSLEVLPGSHRPDGHNGHPSLIQSSVENKNDKKVLPINVPQGTVTIYSSRLWHRGGANKNDDSTPERSFCFMTLMEDEGCMAPPGLVHTMAKEDVGKWVLNGNGIVSR
mmetsp:Transcript_38168/g.55746  ORF Transcript_38168/g.55746 Transcript_38168/m.55746 type:complete len:655 (-) Transcript_38168:267-2231(-)